MPAAMAPATAAQSIDWGTIGPVQQAETYTYTAAPQAPDMVPEFGRVSTDWFFRCGIFWAIL